MRRWWIVLVGMCLVCGGGPRAFARHRRHRKTTTPGTEVPEANPARPTVSTPATLTPVGYLQFENGALIGSGSPEFGTAFQFNQVTKLTVHPRLQVLSQWAPWQHSTATDGSANATGSVSLGVQGVVLPGTGAKPTVAVSYIRAISSSSAPDFDIGSAKNSFLALMCLDIAGVHIDLNGMLNEQVDGRVRRAQYGQAFDITRESGKWSYGGELWHYTQPLTAGNAVGNLWFVAFAPKKNIVFDAGFDHGLTSTSTQWQGFAGLTYLLPHRLW